jgi:plastocyanin
MRKFLALGILTLLLPSLASGAEPGRIVGRVTVGGIQKHPVLVFVTGFPGQAPRPPGERLVMGQKDRVFIPHIIPVVVGTAVEFKNSDPFKHNIFSPDGERYNLGTWEQGKSRSYTFRRPGVYRQLCNIHPEMLAYIIVLETQAFALTDKGGNFEIADVPAGQHTLKVWGEKLAKEQLARTFSVKVEEGSPATVTITLSE